MFILNNFCSGAYTLRKLDERNILISLASFDAEGNAKPCAVIEDSQGYNSYSTGPTEFRSLRGNESCKDVAEFLKLEKERIIGVESVDQVASQVKNMELCKEKAIKRKAENLKSVDSRKKAKMDEEPTSLFFHDFPLKGNS